MSDQLALDLQPLTLRFVESTEHYSRYVEHDGTDVYLAHGTAARLRPFDDLDIHALWREFLLDIHALWRERDTWTPVEQRGEPFLERLRGLTFEPDEVDEYVGFCDDCHEPEHTDDLYSTNEHDGTSVCESCYGDYWVCVDCEQSFKHTTSTLNDTEVCNSCRDRNWHYCEHCQGWVGDEDEDHFHDDDDDDDGYDEDRCGCEAPAQRFRVRNDGNEPLWNDTRVTVALPAGVISEEGLASIANYLRDHRFDTDECGDYTLTHEERARLYDLSSRLDELGDKWQTKQGNFTKRLSRFAYKEFGLKLAPDAISAVGNIAREHSTGVDFDIEVTRDLNQSPHEFAHADSCWWNGYTRSRCALKNNGGFGLRTFNDYDVTGRSWVMPLRECRMGQGRGLTPTFEAFEPDAFVVFNGYGALSGYHAARIVSHMAGWTYRKIGFSCHPMYVNHGTLPNQDESAPHGYLVAPEEIAERYTDGSLNLSVDDHADLYRTEQQEKEKELAHA